MVAGRITYRGRGTIVRIVVGLALLRRGPLGRTLVGLGAFSLRPGFHFRQRGNKLHGGLWEGVIISHVASISVRTFAADLPAVRDRVAAYSPSSASPADDSDSTSTVPGT